MAKRFLRIAGFLSFSFILSGQVAHAAPFGNNYSPSTRVIIFKPCPPPGLVYNGRCDSPSLTVQRKKAWRCVVKNMFFDPCFSTNDPAHVICNADPITKNPGFLVNLTAPLPTGDSPPNPNYAWFLELADHSTCSLRNGYLDYVGSQPIMYTCSDSTNCAKDGACTEMSGILGSPQPGKVWKVSKILFTPSPEGSIIHRQWTENVDTVWQ